MARHSFVFNAYVDVWCAAREFCEGSDGRDRIVLLLIGNVNKHSSRGRRVVQ
jgi:hypothetical protein